MAEACRKRYRIVAEFHITLGISKDVAERDAESIEHHVSEDYLHVLKAFFWGKGEPMRSV
nr:iron dependent repressor, metal binding and dimerization domain protein [Leisingera sp. ANG59]